MLRKLLYFFGFLVALIVIVPLFIDLSKYAEPYLIDAQKTIGRSIKTGSIHLQILPTPRIKVNDVVLGNAPNAKNPNMVSISSVEVMLSLKDLLTGKIVVKSVDVNSPEVNLEKFKDGNANWNLNISQQDKKPETEGKSESSTTNAAAAGLLVKQLNISDATVIYTDHSTGTTKSFSNLSIESETEQLLGPYKINIFCESGLDQLELDILTGEIKLNDKTPIQVNVTLSYEQQKINGKLSGFVDVANKQFSANIAASFAGLKKTIDLPNQKIDLNKEANLKGEIYASETQIDVKNFEVSHPIGSLTGSLQYKLEDSAFSTAILFSHKNDSISVKCKTNDFTVLNYQISSTKYQDILKWFAKDQAIKGDIDISGTLEIKDKVFLLKQTSIQFDGASAVLDTQFNALTNETDIKGKLKDIRSWGKIVGQDLPFAGSASINFKMASDKEGTKISTKLALDNGNLAYDGRLGTGELITKGQLRLENFGLNELVIDLKSGIQVKKKEINLDIQNVHLKSKAGFDLSAGGSILVDLSKEKPNIIGSITAQPVQLTAYNNEQIYLLNAVYNPAEFKYRLIQIAKQNLRWSTEEINLPLSLLNIDLKIAVPKISLSGIVLDAVESEISLLNGKLSIPFSAHLYGGDLSGTLEATTKDKKLSVKFTDVAIAKIPAASAHFKQGKASGNIDLATSGKSQYDFVSRLNGKASFDIVDGIAKGFDLHEIVSLLRKPKNLLDFKLLQNGFSGKGETAFSKASGNFTIKDGVASTNDLIIDAKDATMQIEGEADILNWQMRFTGEIKVPDLKDLPPIKFVIKGPIDSPGYSLDMQQLQKLFMQKGVGDLISKSLGKKIPGLEKVIPGASKQKDESGQAAENKPADSKPAKPEKIVTDIVKGIFG